MEEPAGFLQNELLFSFDQTRNIVAVEYDGTGNMEIFYRESSHLRREKELFRPFILLETPALIEPAWGTVEEIPLAGEGKYRVLALFEHWKLREKILNNLKKKTGFTSGSPGAPFLFPGDPVHQHLLLSGRTLFKGMAFNDLLRLQVDIETYCPDEYEFSNALRVSDRITFIALSDNRGFELALSGHEMDEKAMLEKMITLINEKDPDIIEGHNIHKFDLSYISARARRYGVPLAIGRDGSLLSSHPSRLSIAERNITYQKFEVYGRHIVDTWILAQLYDISYRGLESYGLKDIARHFGVAAEERTYLPPEKLSWYFENEPGLLGDYALDDVRETRSIAEILGYSYFVQTQIFPYSFQNCIVRGNATRIDSLFLRAYLKARRSIPGPSAGKEFEGGYADIFYQGVLQNVVHCDIQSLYPSIMLSFGISPSSDSLGVFTRLLGDLKDFRIKAKECMKRVDGVAERMYYDALQGTFKVLINSFYGYLGFSFGHFSDFEKAAEVTRRGREILAAMIERLKDLGFIIAELDTDGIYFSPRGEGWDEEKILAELSRVIPEDITVEIDGSYRAMFSYKVKNYALLDYQGRMSIKGSGLKSRGLERFQRQFMEELFMLLLSGSSEKIPALLVEYREKFEHHQFPVRMFCKTETLQESPELYQMTVKAKKRNASAAYELALTSGKHFEAGDQVSYYVRGKGKKVRVFDNCALAREWNPESPDENVEYYIDKLQGLYQKFSSFFSGGELSE